MRITMVAIGSTGDTRPYVILGRELKRRGHDVTICAFSVFEEMVLKEGLHFKPIPGDAKSFMGNIMNGSNGMMFLKQVIEAIRPYVDPFLEALEKGCEDAEVIIGSYFGEVVKSIAEIKHVPYIQTHYFPMDKNAATPISSAPGQHMGKGWSLFSYSLGYTVISLIEIHFLADWRKARGMQPRKVEAAPINELNGHPVPTLYAMSPLVMPRPNTWDENIHMTGYWLDKQPASFQPSAEITAFLEAEPTRPIYIGFGSMVSADMNDTLDIVLRSIDKAGLRAVISTGWGGADIPKKDNIFAADYVSHAWLFNQVSAVVHHGGAGTFAAGILAGRPSLIIPFGGDQPFWASRAEALGLGPKSIRHSQLTVHQLTRALTDLTQTKKYRIAAQELGQRLRMENGVTNAANIIEHELRKWLRQEGMDPGLVPKHEEAE